MKRIMLSVAAVAALVLGIATDVRADYGHRYGYGRSSSSHRLPTPGHYRARYGGYVAPRAHHSYRPYGYDRYQRGCYPSGHDNYRQRSYRPNYPVRGHIGYHGRNVSVHFRF